jgi:hypothetical protein
VYSAAELNLYKRELLAPIRWMLFVLAEPGVRSGTWVSG